MLGAADAECGGFLGLSGASGSLGGGGGWGAGGLGAEDGGLVLVSASSVTSLVP